MGPGWDCVCRSEPGDALRHPVRLRDHRGRPSHPAGRRASPLRHRNQSQDLPNQREVLVLRAKEPDQTISGKMHGWNGAGAQGVSLLISMCHLKLFRFAWSVLPSRRETRFSTSVALISVRKWIGTKWASHRNLQTSPCPLWVRIFLRNCFHSK